MVAVNVGAFEIETTTRHGDVVRADVYLPKQPFGQDREFTGQGVLHLHPSSDQTDMDVMVKPSLLPEGEGKQPFVKVTQGWLRASRRVEDPDLTTDMRPFLSHDRDEPITPGATYELRIGLMPMSVLVRAGERLRLEISNWESAHTEAPMTHWYGRKVGTDTYHYDADHPSRLRLHERPRHRATCDSEPGQSP